MTIFVKKYQKKFIPMLGNERGSAFILALMVLIAVTVMAVMTSNTSVTELLISGNDVVSKISFTNSDAGIYAVPKVISKAVNDHATPASMSPPFNFLDVGTDTALGRTFFLEVMGHADHDDAADISFTNDGTHMTEVDIERFDQGGLEGGGNEFSAAGEGPQAELQSVRFMMLSTGRGPRGAVTRVKSRYIKVIDTAGGLN